MEGINIIRQANWHIIVHENGSAEYALQKGFFRHVLHLASEYGWTNPQPDGLYDYSEKHAYIDYEISTDCIYHTIVSYLAEETPSVADALEKAVKDIPREPVYTDDFNPDIDSDRIDSLYEKNMYFKVVYWSWDRWALKRFIQLLK